ncbi:MAG: GNAT family N-acetyltransferase [Nitriliruptoraceae bacterium]
MRGRLRWRRPSGSELSTVVDRLATWPTGTVPGAVRHMFALATIDAHGNDPVRVLTRGRRLAVTVTIPSRLIVPCGDPSLLADVSPPTRRWRLLVGDVGAGDALLAATGIDDRMIVHDQRFMVVDPARVPPARHLADPGLRRAQPADLDRLAELAVRLHIDDEFGPDPGFVGWRGYRQRLEASVRQGLVWCVGPPGAPVCKVERSVSSAQWGVQLAGIVVAPEQRHDGIGRAAVAAAVRGVWTEFGERPVTLHVRAANRRAVDAYRAAGFVDAEAWRLVVRS